MRVKKGVLLSEHLLIILIHTSSDMHKIIATANSIHPVTSTASRPDDELVSVVAVTVDIGAN